MDEKKRPPVIDLHESEWKRDGKHEPIFGPNAKPLLFTMIAAVPCHAIATWVVTGSPPLWLFQLLQ